ncbi:MAG: glycosyltransferase [Hyphomicrobiaceae bacterium]|nr:glycosyltransferase [Hyphomicrobiaceae bacterium]
MSIEQYDLIVVTPVYEDVEASGRLFEELAKQYPKGLFVVAIDDGSVKQPLDISGLQRAGLNGVVLKLRRNVGHQKAIAIGLGYVSEHVRRDQLTVVMDSDGEDVPSTIPNLLKRLRSADTDVVVGKRKSRVETLKFKLFYSLYKRFFRIITGRKINFGNFMALTATSVKRLAAMPESSIHVASAVLASKLRVGTCSLDRGPRYAGQSKMNFVGLVLHGFKGLMVFAEDVLVRVGIASALIAGFCLFGGGAAVVLKALGYATPGWFSVAFGILLLMFLQTGALALMTLMLTGVMRSGSVTTPLVYHDFVEEVIESRSSEASS